jgi:argininosuccinate synthase
MNNINKVVLAYSGGLDTSVIVKWLIENYKCEVVCYAADVGQEEELDGLDEKARATGASKCYVEDLREEFITDFIYPALHANAVYENRYLLGTSLARPVIAKRHVEIARKENADAVCHGATGKGNDQVRFELGFKSLAPDLKIIAPWREWELHSRSLLFDYAEKHSIPLPINRDKPFSMDRNLLHISYEGGVLEDPYYEPDESMFLLTVSPDKAPDTPEYVEIYFKEGNPVAVNGEKLPPIDIMKTLNTIAGRNGVGRVDIVENRLVGIKSRGVYETPGGTLLWQAHRDLESICLDRDTQHLKDKLAVDYSILAYNGTWFTRIREALDAFMQVTQKNVNGTVKLKLYKGMSTVVGRKSETSLYLEDMASFEHSDLYDHSDATGFINLFGLQSKVEAMLKNKK